MFTVVMRTMVTRILRKYMKKREMVDFDDTYRIIYYDIVYAKYISECVLTPTLGNTTVLAHIHAWRCRIFC